MKAIDNGLASWRRGEWSCNVYGGSSEGWSWRVAYWPDSAPELTEGGHTSHFFEAIRLAMRASDRSAHVKRDLTSDLQQKRSETAVEGS